MPFRRSRLWRRAGELGFLRVDVPAADRGNGSNPLSYCGHLQDPNAAAVDPVLSFALNKLEKPPRASERWRTPL